MKRLAYPIFTPVEGETYLNNNGINYTCVEVLGQGKAIMKSESGWICTCHGIRKLDNDTIEWDYSTGGKFAKKTAARSIEIYTFDELSDEAKEKALKDYRDYFAEHFAYDFLMDEFNQVSDDGFYLGMELTEIGLPIEDITDIYFDWNKAWIILDTDLDSFLKSSGVTLKGNGDTKDIVKEIFNYYEPFKISDYGDLNCHIDANDIKAAIEDYFYDFVYENDEEFDTEQEEEIAYDEAKKEYVDKYFDEVKEVVDYVINEFEDRLAKGNELVTAIMDDYGNPSDEYLIEGMEANELEFFADGRRY